MKLGSGYWLCNCEKFLFYIRVCELFIEVFIGIVDNIKVYGFYSLWLGGVIVLVVRGILDRIFKRYGCWCLEFVKDGYV